MRINTNSLLAAAATLGLAAGPAALTSAQEGYEYEPGTGTHEEEWYDPTDWFDDDFGYDTGTDVEETGYDRSDYRYGSTYGSGYNSAYDARDDSDFLSSDLDGNSERSDRAYESYYQDQRDAMSANFDSDSAAADRAYDTRRNADSSLQFRTTNRSDDQPRQRASMDRGSRDRVQMSTRRSNATSQSEARERIREMARNQNQSRNAQEAQPSDSQRQNQMDRQRRQAQRPDVRIAGGDQPFGQRQVVQGRLIRVQDVQLQGVEDSHRLVKVKTRDGEAVVDLGSTKNFSDFDLERDDYVIVFGETGRIDNTNVVFARHIAELNSIPRDKRAERAARSASAER